MVGSSPASGSKCLTSWKMQASTCQVHERRFSRGPRAEASPGCPGVGGDTATLGPAARLQYATTSVPRTRMSSSSSQLGAFSTNASEVRSRAETEPQGLVTQERACCSKGDSRQRQPLVKARAGRDSLTDFESVRKRAPYQLPREHLRDDRPATAQTRAVSKLSARARPAARRGRDLGACA